MIGDITYTKKNDGVAYALINQRQTPLLKPAIRGDRRPSFSSMKLIGKREKPQISILPY